MYRWNHDKEWSNNESKTQITLSPQQVIHVEFYYYLYKFNARRIFGVPCRLANFMMSQVYKKSPCKIRSSIQNRQYGTEYGKKI